MPPLFALDDYDRCLLYNGTYCVIRTDLFAEPDHELMNLMINYTKSSPVKHYDHTYQNKGICLTTACKDFIGDKDLNSQSDLQKILDECENHTMFEKYGFQAKVAGDFYCDTKETRVDKKDTLDWTVLGVLVLILLFNICATIYDLTLDDESKDILRIGERMILCFSLRRNWNYLMSTSSSDPKTDKLQGINGIRALSSFIMILGHVVWIHTMGFMDNPHDYERSYELPHYQVIYNGMVIVQIFFVLSGFLLIYNLEAAAEEKRLTWKVLPLVAMHRIWRLSPSLALTVAVNATWVRFLGSGPLWKRYVYSMVHDCRQYWWSHLLYVNNYVTNNKYCVVQSWHTAADTQMFFLGITVYLLTRRRHLPLVAGVVFLLALLLPALHIYFQDLGAQMLMTPEFLRSLSDASRPNYVFGHNNMVCFLLGMVVGYKAHRWQKQGVVFHGKVARVIFSLFMVPVFSSFFAGTLFHEEDYRTPMWMRMLWQSTHRLILGVGIAVLLVGMIMEQNSIQYRFISWPGFKVLGKLIYSVFLIHITFTHLMLGGKSNLGHFSYLPMILNQFGIVCMTYLLAIPFFLMVEAPLNPLLKLILTRGKSASSDKSTMMPDSTKNFIAEVIKVKRKRVGNKNTNEKEVAVENAEASIAESNEIGTNMDENIMNGLLEDGARECNETKMKTN